MVVYFIQVLISERRPKCKVSILRYLDLNCRKQKFIRLVIVALMIGGQHMLASAQELEVSKLTLGERRKIALQAAKEGRFNDAAKAFEALVIEAPDDIGIKADQIVVLTWAKNNQDATAVAKKIDVNLLPTYGLNALARAARDSKQYVLADSYYELLMSRDISNLDPFFGKILTMIDAGRFAEAEAFLMKLRQLYPNNIEVYRAFSYLGKQSKRPVIVVDANTRILEMNHLDLEAASALINAAREAGAIKPAMRLAAQYPNVIDKNQIDKINQDSAAQHIAWGHFNAKAPAQRFAETDIALAKLDKVCECDWRRLDLSSDRNKNLVFDRIVALRDRYRMQEAINHYQQLVDQKIDSPDYVLTAAGDAYLYKRMPQEALNAYNLALLKTPNNLQTKFSKFYALIELEKFDEATKLVDETSSNLAPYRNRSKNPVIRADEFKLEADSKAFLARAYGDDLAMADDNFQALNNVGPTNNEVRIALGEVWRLRGWPNRAEQRFQTINTDYPDQLSPKLNLANLHLDLHEWQLAENEIRPLLKNYPENLAVQELEQRWRLRNERQLTIDAFSSNSSGATFGSRTQGMNATLYSRPFEGNYRAFVSTKYDHATFTEGSGHVVYPGIGLEYTSRDWRLTGELSQASYASIGVSSTLTADYRLDDFWSFTSLLDINSSQMPLRGQRVGTSADLFSVSANYRWSDLARASAGVSYMQMEDGNRRQSLNLTLDKRLVTKPHYKLTLHLRGDASQNSESDVNYFNPKRDTEMTAVLDNEWMLWRKYDRSFSHRLQVGAGQYWQKNIGTNTTWLISYEQQFRWDNRFEVDYGITRSQHPYDGINEISTQLFAHLNLLF